MELLRTCKFCMIYNLGDRICKLCVIHFLIHKVQLVWYATREKQNSGKAYAGKNNYSGILFWKLLVINVNLNSLF